MTDLDVGARARMVARVRIFKELSARNPASAFAVSRRRWSLISTPCPTVRCEAEVAFDAFIESYQLKYGLH
jgi:hypothetical protein